MIDRRSFLQGLLAAGLAAPILSKAGEVEAIELKPASAEQIMTYLRNSERDILAIMDRRMGVDLESLPDALKFVREAIACLEVNGRIPWAQGLTGFKVNGDGSRTATFSMAHI